MLKVGKLLGMTKNPKLRLKVYTEQSPKMGEFYNPNTFLLSDKT